VTTQEPEANIKAEEPKANLKTQEPRANLKTEEPKARARCENTIAKGNCEDRQAKSKSPKAKVESKCEGTAAPRARDRQEPNLKATVRATGKCVNMYIYTYQTHIYIHINYISNTY